MSVITIHVLDTTTGKPGAGIPVGLERKTHSSGWQNIADGITGIDGRLSDLLSAQHVFLPGHYRLTLDAGAYFLLGSVDCFFPQISISFVVKDPQQHYHIPLLLGPFGYTVYRGG